MDLTLKAWSEELTYALAIGSPGAWGMMTVATCKTAAAGAEVMETARRVVAARGLSLIELDARTVAADPGLLPSEAGFVILHDVKLPLRPAVPLLVGGFQQLVMKNLFVGMLVMGSPAGIKALRRQGLGLVNRAEVLDV
ncbi:hypothetical protein SRABI26_00336 [Arthrobacter sp. Bi26]|uniref:hypothetical protein n=1 Tax=Arthrobacter sp. Bi26 TaxID=2822350 RepID=UPI001E175D36|nr:hypothetical protein [Arthrobacter sp. Bi26]CAH0135584.1 hypothetical protein SRABI26_00336 [Arthrobacter sp. Bi26]